MTGWRDTRPSAQDAEARFKSPPDPTILGRLHDAHCHPGDDPHFETESLARLDTAAFCVMSSSLSNQRDTKVVHRSKPARVIPCFGLHPWFSHPISFAPRDALPSKEEHYAGLFPATTTTDDDDDDGQRRPHPSLATVLESLPEPVSIDSFLETLERDLVEYPTSFVGEIGLDQAFKLPNPALRRPSRPGSPPRAKHSDLSTPISHQLRVVEAQFRLAIRMNRNVSQHCVRSTSDTVQLLQRLKREHDTFESIYVCLHSFGASAETAKQIQRHHGNVFFSFSTIVSGRSPKFYKLLRAIEPDRLLLESDFSDTSQIDLQIWEIFEAVCEAREWTRDEAVETLSRNWARFTRPNEERRRAFDENMAGRTPNKSNRQRKRERRQIDLYVSDDDDESERTGLGSVVKE